MLSPSGALVSLSLAYGLLRSSSTSRRQGGPSEWMLDLAVRPELIAFASHRLEACLFLPAWSASVPLAIALPVQALLAWSGLPPPISPSAERADALSVLRLHSQDRARRTGVHSVELYRDSMTKRMDRQGPLEHSEQHERSDKGAKDEEEEVRVCC